MTSTETFSSAAIVAPSHLATQTGLNIIAQGGNAIEAMVAMAATMAVVYPHLNGIGGDGFWLIRDPRGKMRSIEASGYAGAKATLKFYRDHEVDAIPARGPVAALTVPGAIGGWLAALDLAKALGARLSLRDLLNDAIGHARNIYPVSKSEARTPPRDAVALAAMPAFNSAYLDDGKHPEAGFMRKSPMLADTIDHLAAAGLSDFYRGDIARELDADLEKIGAPLTREDLRRYESKWREPLQLRLKGRTHFNLAPPTQGLASLVTLGVFDRLGVKRCDSFEHLHGLIESAKRAFAIAYEVCADFDHHQQEPEEFLDPVALEREASRISMSKAANFSLPQTSRGDAIFMAAIDKNGVAVSCMQSIGSEYGSGCVLPKTGVLLNNSGSSFSLDADATNALSPGRKPPQALNPAMTLFDDGRIMAYGATGGQPQIQAQIFTRTNFGMGLAEAIDAPRFAFDRDRSLLAIEDGFDPSVIRALENAGHDVSAHTEDSADAFGHAGGMIRYPRDGRIEAAQDPRADGGAKGF